VCWRGVGMNVNKEKIVNKGKWFFPCISVLAIFAGWNNCYDLFDIFILLGLWFTIFCFCMLMVLYPKWFVIEKEI